MKIQRLLYNTIYSTTYVQFKINYILTKLFAMHLANVHNDELMHNAFTYICTYMHYYGETFISAKLVFILSSMNFLFFFYFLFLIKKISFFNCVYLCICKYVYSSPCKYVYLTFVYLCKYKYVCSSPCKYVYLIFVCFVC